MGKPNTDSKKSFNQTVTVMFQTASGNFMTPELDEDRIQEISAGISALRPGNTLFLKRSKTPNKSGKYSFFLEIADPSKFARPTAQSEDSLD